VHIAFLDAQPPEYDGVLFRALRDDVRFPFVVIGEGDEYEVVHADGAPDGREGVTLINPFEVEPTDDERFLAAWHAIRERLATQRGYLGTRLHRGDDAPYRFVNVARWSSPLMFSRALGAIDTATPFTSHPALYLIV
jgi:hypothetical protein